MNTFPPCFLSFLAWPPNLVSESHACPPRCFTRPSYQNKKCSGTSCVFSNWARLCRNSNGQIRINAKQAFCQLSLQSISAVSAVSRFLLGTLACISKFQRTGHAKKKKKKKEITAEGERRVCGAVQYCCRGMQSMQGSVSAATLNHRTRSSLTSILHYDPAKSSPTRCLIQRAPCCCGSTSLGFAHCQYGFDILEALGVLCYFYTIFLLCKASLP